MTHEKLLEYCLEKNGAYIDFPFGNDVTCVKVKKRIFAQLFYLRGVKSVTFNCDKMTGDFYRQLYPDAVKRGYHCPQIQQPYFNTVNLEMNISDEEILQMADHSYAYVVGKLTKKLQAELDEEKMRN